MSSICDDLRAAILQAAMQGKLTEQLPEDGKAEDLLKEIRIEKEKLIVEGKIKKQRALAPIADDEIPFSIPENWRWARMRILGRTVENIGFSHVLELQFIATHTHFRVNQSCLLEMEI